MPQIDTARLSGSLKNGLHPLYVIHGEEALLRIETLDTLRAAAKAHGYLNRESHTADSTSFDWNGVLANAGSAGLFADLKLLEIHVPSGKVGKNGGEALLKLAENLPPDTVTLLVFPKLERTQTQSKWFAALTKYGSVLEAKPVTTAALPAWIGERLRGQGLEAEHAALQLFAERVEGNLLAAKQEIDKLALIYPKGHFISVQDAQNSIADVARFDVFQRSAAWLSGDERRTAHLLDGLAGEEDEPVLLLWSLAEDIRMLIRLSAALKQGKSLQSVRNELRLWGGKDRFAEQAAARIQPAMLMEALQECARIDRQIKGAETGNARASLRTLAICLATRHSGSLKT